LRRAPPSDGTEKGLSWQDRKKSDYQKRRNLFGPRA